MLTLFLIPTFFYSRIIASGLILHSSIFIVLFTNFYIRAYKDKPRETNNNDVKTINGHLKTDNGHIKPENGHCKTENGHFGNGFVSSGHLTLPNGFTNHENGYVKSENGYLKNGYTNGHVPHVTDKQKVQ